MPSFTHPDAVFLGLDVHKDSISVGILNPGHERPDVEKIFHDEESVRRLIDRFPDQTLLWSCYEAGPTGYDLARLLKSLGVHCVMSRDIGRTCVRTSFTRSPGAGADNSEWGPRRGS